MSNGNGDCEILETPNEGMSIVQLYNLLIKANTHQTEDIKAEIQHNITTVSNTLQRVNLETENLKKKNLYLERKSRKNNVIIFGLHSNDENLLENTIKVLNELLEVNIKEEHINNIYRIGQNNSPAVIIEFISYLKKRTLFQNIDALKKLKEKGIAIANDQCYEDRQEQKVLRKHLKIARSQNLEAKIKGFRLFINNKAFTAKELKDSEKNVQTSSESEDESIEDEIQDEHNKLAQKACNSIQQPSTSEAVSATNVRNSKSSPKSQLQLSSKRKWRKTYKYSPKGNKGTRITRNTSK